MSKLSNKIMIFWRIKTEQEKKLIWVGGTSILILVIWIFWLDPIIKKRQQLIDQLPELRHQLVVTQALAHKISQLTDLPSTTPINFPNEVEKSLTIAGLTAQEISIDQQAITVKFEKISFARLINWIHAVQMQCHMLIVEASIVPMSQPDQVDAILTFKKLM